MSERRIADLLSGIATSNVAAECVVNSITLDSRKVKPGTLFLACSGGDQHGLDYIQQALESGAVAVLYELDDNWDKQKIEQLNHDASVPLIEVPELSRKASKIAGRFYGNPSRYMGVTGITGTNGKTSSAIFLAQALGEDGNCGIVGTIGNGFPGELKPSTHTTPDPIELQRLLSELRQQGATSISMEVSSHALEQGRVEDVHFDVAVFTNLSRDHLDYHGSMEAYGESKLRLFKMPGIRCAVINLDDEFGRKILRKLPAGVLALGYGLTKQDELPDRLDGWAWAQDVKQDSHGMTVRIQTSHGDGELKTGLLGRFNISNLLAVLNVLLSKGVSLEAALERISRLETVPGRMERFGGNGKPLVVVDYAHTPDALEHALEAARAHTGAHMVCVFGCGGDRDTGKRPEMGAIAERLADKVVITDDNPRTEDGDWIITDILKGMDNPSDVLVERDRAKAIRKAIAGASAGDLIMVCGKGHEDYQLVGDQRLNFSDSEHVQRALEEAVHD